MEPHGLGLAKWQVLAELFLLSQAMCEQDIDPIEIATMDKEVPVLCKLEKILPPGFFVPMLHQHLISFTDGSPCAIPVELSNEEGARCKAK